MEYTLEEKYQLIKEEVSKHTSKNPIEIVKSIMHKDYISIHGPEHHFLDGAAFMVAYKNVKGDIDLDIALDMLAARTVKMPGGMCGNWGMCGSVASLASCLSIIHEVGPLSDNQYYADDMEYSSLVLNEMSKIGGPRCCKRNAFLSLSNAVKFVEKKYGIQMELEDIKCEFTDFNQQCIKERCPFYNKG